MFALQSVFVALMCFAVENGECLSLKSIKFPEVADVRGNVDLECHFDMEKDILKDIKWYKDNNEFFRYEPKRTPPYISFEVAGVHVLKGVDQCNLKNCYVSLHQLSKAHSGGSYRCEVTSEGPSFKSVSETGNIIVAALPNKELRIEGLRIDEKYVEGEQITANCVSDVSDPAPILSWYINTNEAPSKSVGEMKTAHVDDELGSVSKSLTLNFTVDKKMATASKVEVRCEAKLPGIPWQPQTTGVVLTTRHAATTTPIPPPRPQPRKKSNQNRPVLAPFLLPIALFAITFN
ncbi:PREDICTED: uncharacterized protein LOC108568987 [Nicrophorus vespilloides]|uniref:Uncharacterized protein LOC108568987 n=1 Tax=Nicrophorus vespilloides TaxID=110193 RepID=A0ABM1NG83_NICVS|nr:PREDICTED: uncharacterized protein LOC108568987 [Nicrophorus vespilloides]